MMHRQTNTIGGAMDNTNIQSLTAAEYFLTRKNHMERHIEGEHAWLGDVDQSVQFNARPWYLNAACASETHTVF